MGTTYTGLKIKNTYGSIIKVSDNSNLTAFEKQLSDGLGNDTGLYIGTNNRLGIGISPTEALHVSGNFNLTGEISSTGNRILITNSSDPELFIRESVGGDSIKIKVHGSTIAGNNALDSKNDFDFLHNNVRIFGFNGSLLKSFVNIDAQANSIITTGVVSFGSLTDSGESITITKFVDETDGIGNNDNDTTIPTSAAVKDYVDTNITAQDLDFSDGSTASSVDLDSQTFVISGTSNEIETSASGQTITIGLPTNVTLGGTLQTGNQIKVHSSSNAFIEFKHDDGSLNSIGSAESIDANFGDKNDMLIQSTAGKIGLVVANTVSPRAMVIGEDNNTTIGGQLSVTSDLNLQSCGQIRDVSGDMLIENENNSGHIYLKTKDSGGNFVNSQITNSDGSTFVGVVAFDSLKDTAENITISKFVDEADGIGSNDNDTTIPTSAAVKDFVDSQITAEDLDFSDGSTAGSVDLNSQTLVIQGTANEVETSASNQTLTIGLPNDVTISGNTNINGGVLTLGVADTSSGNINAFENMTFNIDTDNDDTSRYFAFYTNAASGGGTELLKIEESGNATFAGSITTTSTSGVIAPLGVFSSASLDTNVLRFIKTGSVGYNWQFPAADSIRFGPDTGSDKKLSFTNSGSGNFLVGIGTDAPDRIFTINNGGPVVEIDPAGASSNPIYFNYNRSTSAYLTPQYWALGHDFRVNGGTSALTLDSSQNATFSPSGGQITLGANGHITSKQSLDVATAGGRFIGSSNRGILGQIRIEQTANSTDGGYIALDTCASGSTSPTERVRVDSSGDVGIKKAGADTLLYFQNTSSLTSGNRGNIAFYNSDTSTVALIRAGAVTDNVGTDLQFYTRPASGSLTETMRISSTGIVGMGATGIYTSGTTAQLNLPSYALAIKNNVSGSNNNWSYIRNTGTGSNANIEFTTGIGIALTLNHDKSATFLGTGTFTSASSYVLTAKSTDSDAADIFRVVADDDGLVASVSKDASDNGEFYVWSGAQAANIQLYGGTGNATFAGKILTTSTGSSSVAALQFGNAGLGIATPSTDQLNFITADSTRMVIDSSGNVSIGSDDNNGRVFRIAGSGDLLQLTSINDSAAGAQLDLTHERPGGAHDDDNVGIINFTGLDAGSNNTTFASIKTIVTSTSSETADITFTTRTDASNFTEKMRITSAGNVGIGGHIPSKLFSVIGVDGRNSTTYVAEFVNNDNTSDQGHGVYVQGGTNSNHHLFQVNAGASTIGFAVKGNALVGFGTTSAGNTNAYFSFDSGTASNQLNLGSNTTSLHTLVNFRDSTNGVIGNVQSNSGGVSFNSISDYRLKENIVGMTSALDRVSQLKPSQYNLKKHKDNTVEGFIAHELQEVFPQAVSGEKDKVNDKGEPEYQFVDNSKLVPLLVGAIQELKAEIEILKNK